MKIIDVSVHQGNINWNKVAADGVEGAVIRAGYGKGNKDQMFQANIEGAIDAGLKYIGAYWFSYAYTAEMAVNEAIYANEILEPYKEKLNLGVYFDWEYDSMNYAKKNSAAMSRNTITEMNVLFCENIRKLGYIGGYYLNYDYQNNYIDTSKLKGFRKWYAWYNSALNTDCYLWQYSSSAKRDGINGNVDINELVGSVPETSDYSQEVDRKSNQELAQEVIEGKWGNGYTRKNRLTKAGYDYEEVQRIVNEMLNTSTSEIYIVKAGDTLSEIAQKYNTTVNHLAAKNNIRNVNRIYPGQKIYI